jgi:hypothetical protein
MRGRPIAPIVLSPEERAYLERQVRRHRVARSSLPSKSVAAELGVHEHWDPIKAYWADPSADHRQALDGHAHDDPPIRARPDARENFDIAPLPPGGRMKSPTASGAAC